MQKRGLSGDKAVGSREHREQRGFDDYVTDLEGEAHGVRASCSGHSPSTPGLSGVRVPFARRKAAFPRRQSGDEPEPKGISVGGHRCTRERNRGIIVARNPYLKPAMWESRSFGSFTERSSMSAFSSGTGLQKRKPLLDVECACTSM